MLHSGASAPTNARHSLTVQTIASLKETFARTAHEPSPEMWESLTEIAHVMEEMAEGVAEDAIYLASLDPGVGKTQVVIHFLRSLMNSEEHTGVSVIVCVGRLDEIRGFIRDANLSEATYAVFTKDEGLNGLGLARPEEARILFTTHAMVQSRCRRRTFAEVSELHYQGHAREVRIWDEAILPGRTLTVTRDDIAALRKPMRSVNAGFVVALESLDGAIRDTAHGTQIMLPDLGAESSLELNDVLHVLREATDDRRDHLQKAVSSLWPLFGKVVTVRKDGLYGSTILDYEENLPQDASPLLVLDASARVRQTYELWGTQRGGIIRLSHATKDYSPLTIHVWKTGGGKEAFSNRGERLIKGVVQTIDTKPDEEWLVVHHKLARLDVQQRTYELLAPRSAPVHFVHWGAHDSTNKFVNVPNIILAGTLFYRPADYEALGRLAARKPSASGPWATGTTREVMLGEHRHHILQALCRGAVRKCRGASCWPTNAYIIAGVRSGIAEELPRIFPGASVAAWQPLPTEIKGKAGAAAKYVIEALKEGAENTSVSFADVMKHIGVDPRNFRKDIRKHEEFKTALAEHGLIEWPEKRPTTFKRAVDVYFGAEAEEAGRGDLTGGRPPSSATADPVGLHTCAASAGVPPSLPNSAELAHGS